MANALSAELVQKVPVRTPPERFDEAQATPGSTRKDLELPQDSPSGASTTAWIPPNYFAPEQLSRRPRLRTAISLDALDLPPEAASGTLIIQLLLSADGSVDEVIVASSTLPQPLVNAATQAFSSASFEPGQIAGTPVRSQFVLEVRYEAHHP
ncbi:MAG: energy transducer TonB [Dechloromonas sp.]|nr:energy transducer TonB [Dechloromonas sp.]